MEFVDPSVLKQATEANASLIQRTYANSSTIFYVSVAVAVAVIVLCLLYYKLSRRHTHMTGIMVFSAIIFVAASFIGIMYGQVARTYAYPNTYSEANVSYAAVSPKDLDVDEYGNLEIAEEHLPSTKGSDDGYRYCAKTIANDGKYVATDMNGKKLKCVAIWTHEQVYTLVITKDAYKKVVDSADTNG